ncbi:hypothetical protein KKP04_06950 [Rhodomicrobium sp. Az07]|uniref:hypothetical protein n=1 Tax=Rhodomicrobium sp. Az07 TaxID=2839034 RepID=UPI001BEC99A7|nr:hypothetical protein [Rhodomicrobium sp. Az07]MBT3070602.1 hypothetical protein [Rhodomicrobium sp. Az07]
MPDKETRLLRLFDLAPREVIEVQCPCGKIVHFPNGYLQRKRGLPSDTLIFDLQFKLRCRQCGGRDGFRIAIVDLSDVGDSSKPARGRLVAEGVGCPNGG